MDQESRNLSMKEFRSATTRIMIASDLVARGIDVNPVGLVVNFDLPKDNAKYIHRVGRSGRFGRRGIAINLISKLEARKMLDLEAYYST
jgi:translation initiation factor 4A